MDFVVIAISGKAQSGKTSSKESLKKLFEEKYPDYKVIVKPFAEKLKEIATNVFGWDGDKNLCYKETFTHNAYDFDTLTQELIQDEGRQLLINIGKKMREIRGTVWADYVSKQIIADIKNEVAHKKVYIIDDLRFKNELVSLSRFGAKLVTVRINRKEELNIDDISEKDLDDYSDWTYYINNNFSLESLDAMLSPVVDTAILASKTKVHCEE